MSEINMSGGRPLVSTRTPFFPHVFPSYSYIKRSFDILFVLVAAPAASTLIAFCCVGIFLTMGRPIFFNHHRVGRGGRIFKMFKLRTMDHGDHSVVIATAKDDPRITPFGRFLRRSHLDELPQLWNIVKGDMSLIGPRPEQPKLVEAYKASLPNYDLRHSVAPGLTGLAQVNFGYASDLHETREKLAYDLKYVHELGPAMDFRILVRTVVVYSNPKYVR